MASLLTSFISFVHGTPKSEKETSNQKSPEIATIQQEVTASKAKEAIEAQPQLSKTASPETDSTSTPASASIPAPAPALAISSTQPKPTEERIQILGLEDPSDSRIQDDPTIFSNKERIPLPPPGSEPVNTLVDSQGQAYIDPKVYGGSMLDKVDNGLGEPLNVIVSSLSSPELLTKKGVQTYLRSLDFDFECLGLHGGGYQQAYVDPRGYLDQNFIFREIYTPFDHVFGTCIESLIGGNHVRAWQQQGTGAWFFAISKEQNISTRHDLVENGYDVGRDLFVQQSQKEKNGVTSFIGKKYQTKVEWVTNLLAAGTQGVNHAIPTDGRTAVLTVTRLDGTAKAIYSTQVKEQKAEEKRQKKVEESKSKEEKKSKRQSLPAKVNVKFVENENKNLNSSSSQKKKWYKRISLAA